MDGQTVVGIVVGALFLAGLVGALIPWIPGPLFILIGVLVWAVATQFAVIGVGRLVILVTLALTTLLVNFAAGPIGARPSGGRPWAVGGAIVGAVARPPVRPPPPPLPAVVVAGLRPLNRPGVRRSRA